MTTHDLALQWAADRAGLPYERFVKGLTPETIARIRIAYMRQNSTAIPLPAVSPSVESEQPAPSAVAASVEASPADPETTLCAAFQANMHTLPLMVSAWKYKRFLAALHITTKDEKKLLEKIVREEIRNVIEPTAIKLNHLLWWLEGQ